MRKYRIFYHYYRQYNCLSVHYRGKCHRVKDTVCNIPTETKWNKTQPNLVVRGWVKSLEIKGDIAYIN